MLHKPMSHGLAVELAYTWSRLYDDMDDSGWGEQFGDVYYQDAYNPSANYATSNFNRPNVLKGTVIYSGTARKGTSIPKFGLRRCGAGRLGGIR